MHGKRKGLAMQSGPRGGSQEKSNRAPQIESAECRVPAFLNINQVTRLKLCIVIRNQWQGRSHYDVGLPSSASRTKIAQIPTQSRWPSFGIEDRTAALGKTTPDLA